MDVLDTPVAWNPRAGAETRKEPTADTAGKSTMKGGTQMTRMTRPHRVLLLCAICVATGVFVASVARPALADADVNTGAITVVLWSVAGVLALAAKLGQRSIDKHQRSMARRWIDVGALACAGHDNRYVSADGFCNWSGPDSSSMGSPKRIGGRVAAVSSRGRSG